MSLFKKINFAYPLLAAGVFLLGVSAAIIYSPEEAPVSDDYTRANVVKLVSENGSCSGIHIKTRAGRYYVLTAAHCATLSIPGPFDRSVITGDPLPSVLIATLDAQGNKEFLRVLDIDPLSDLMLLESNIESGVRLGDSAPEKSHVHTVTHGYGMPTYRTDGEVIKEVFEPQGAPSWFVKTLTTAFILPGSSGGALFNTRNELVGIVTHGDETHFFSYFATIYQIKAFLKGR